MQNRKPFQIIFNVGRVKLQLHDAIYRPRFFSNSLIHILLLSNLHNSIASIQKNPGDKSHRVTVVLQTFKVGRVVRNRTFIYKGLTVA